MADLRLLPLLAITSAGALLAGCAGALAPGPYGVGGQAQPGYAGPAINPGRTYGSYATPNYGDPAPRSGAAYGAYAAPAPAAFPNVAYASWQDDEPDYRLYPGDQIDVTVLSAPELNRSVAVQPDGRISVPLVPPLMVADRPIPQVEQMLSAAYASQLVRPQVSISLKQATPLKVFVAGEVDKPGIYDMPGDIDALQAVVMAGGFKPSAKSGEVVIIRRGAGGQPMMRTANLRRAARFSAGGQIDAVPLRRFDVIYVPRKAVAEVALFVQQYLRDPLPFQFSYVLNGAYVTTR